MGEHPLLEEPLSGFGEEGALPLGSPLQDTLWEAPAEGLTRTLCPSQMWTSVWRGPTAATSMLSARTPHARTSASASPATRGTANTAKVRLGGTCTGGPAGGGGGSARLAGGCAVLYAEACDSHWHGGGVEKGEAIFSQRAPLSPLHQLGWVGGRSPGTEA